MIICDKDTKKELFVWFGDSIDTIIFLRDNGVHGRHSSDVRYLYISSGKLVDVQYLYSEVCRKENEEYTRTHDEKGRSL